jgi:hypothetical protein
MQREHPARSHIAQVRKLRSPHQKWLDMAAPSHRLQLHMSAGRMVVTTNQYLEYHSALATARMSLMACPMEWQMALMNLMACPMERRMERMNLMACPMERRMERMNLMACPMERQMELMNQMVCPMERRMEQMNQMVPAREQGRLEQKEIQSASLTTFCGDKL